MNSKVIVELTESQVAELEELIVEAKLDNGMILGTVTKREGELLAVFNFVPNALALEIIKIAGGESEK